MGKECQRGKAQSPRGIPTSKGKISKRKGEIPQCLKVVRRSGKEGMVPKLQLPIPSSPKVELTTPKVVLPVIEVVLLNFEVALPTNEVVQPTIEIALPIANVAKAMVDIDVENIVSEAKVANAMADIVEPIPKIVVESAKSVEEPKSEPNESNEP